jgi:hypothetical protein
MASQMHVQQLSPRGVRLHLPCMLHQAVRLPARRDSAMHDWLSSPYTTPLTDLQTKYVVMSDCLPLSALDACCLCSAGCMPA